MSILPPELDANYELLEEMHEGGMGAVYKARHRHLDERCVIKVMHAKLDDVPGARERFFSEAKRGKQIRHRNIAEVLAFFVGTNGKAYLVMEYVDGETLQAVLLKRGRVDARTIVTIGVQTLAALACLHERHLIHRDISPDNLMLTKDAGGKPLIKLIDLGIAKALDETTGPTRTGYFVGKFHYASPEQFHEKVDARSDLYSLGVVLYELATGANPNRDMDTMAIVAAALRDEPPPSFDVTDPQRRVPPALRAVILKALAKKRENRFQSAAEFSQALERALESDKTTEPMHVVPPMPAPPTVREPIRIMPRLGIAAALLLLLGGYFVTARMMRLPRAEPQPAPITTSAAAAPAEISMTVTAPQVAAPEQRQSAADAIARGKKLASERKTEEAYAAFAEATKSDPRNAYAWANLGAAAALLSRTSEARSAYERALAIDPSNWLAHYNLACLLTGSGARDEALRHLEVTAAQLRIQTKSREELNAVMSSIRADEALGALRNDSRFISLFGE